MHENEISAVDEALGPGLGWAAPLEGACCGYGGDTPAVDSLKALIVNGQHGAFPLPLINTEGRIGWSEWTATSCQVSCPPYCGLDGWPFYPTGFSGLSRVKRRDYIATRCRVNVAVP